MENYIEYVKYFGSLTLCISSRVARTFKDGEVREIRAMNHDTKKKETVAVHCSIERLSRGLKIRHFKAIERSDLLVTEYSTIG